MLQINEKAPEQSSCLYQTGMVPADRYRHYHDDHRAVRIPLIFESSVFTDFMDLLTSLYFRTRNEKVFYLEPIKIQDWIV